MRGESGEVADGGKFEIDVARISTGTSGIFIGLVDPGDVVDALIESAVPAFVVPAKFQNRICKEHHFMGCYHCSKRAVEQGGAY